MQIQVTFRHVEASEAVKEYARTRLVSSRSTWMGPWRPR